MKMPSLFRVPRYQKFHIEPRYYDPIKEEVEKRERMIHRELAKGKEEIDRPDFSSRIEGAFTKRKSTSNQSATFTQLVIMLLLACLIFGYIYFGENALYIFGTLSALLLFLRVKRII